MVIGTVEHLTGLAAALMVGLVIGLERGWRGRALAEGGRIAGLRTFALTGLLGGALASMKDALGAWPLFAGLIGLSILMAVAYLEARRASGDLSITTFVALFLTLSLGASAALGQVATSLGAAVVVAVLLNLKPTLHRWLRLIENEEMAAGLQLLVLSVVILPNLPDIGMGPFEALNPRRLWLAVVLIASLSMAGHVAMRLTGAHRGVFLTGLLGGLASSTAATLALARCAARQSALSEAALAGVMAACGMMFLRMAALVAVLAPALLAPFSPALVLSGLFMLTLGLWRWRRISAAPSDPAQLEPMTPFDLGTALGFGLFLALMALLVPWVKQWLGVGGVHAVAALSGLADVDAVVVTITRIYAVGELSLHDCVLALSLGALANTLTKFVLAWTNAGMAFGLKLLAASAASIAAGALVLLVTLPPA